MNAFSDNYINIKASKLVFNDQNLAKYIEMLFYHHAYCFTHDDSFLFLEEEDRLSQINSLLSDYHFLDGSITMALSNRHIVCLFYILYRSSFDYVCNRKENRKANFSSEEKEILGLLNSSSIMKRFIDISSGPFPDKTKTINKEKLKAAQENIIKNKNEQLKAANLYINRLEDENEQLKQRIEKAKKIWDENTRIKEENEKLKLMLKKLEVNDLPMVSISTDEDLPVQGHDASIDESGTIPMMTELSTPSKNNMDHTRSYAHTFRERGRFGSHPSHDNFGDESEP